MSTPAALRREIAIVTACNNEDVLEDNLLQSPMLRGSSIECIIERGHENAGKAYNHGLNRTSADTVVFAHQDVYFPPSWPDQLMNAIAWLDQNGAPWGVLGVWGVKRSGTFAGRVWCTGGNQEHVGPVSCPNEVESIDEIVIVLRGSSGLRFDEGLPGFHLYATDIVLQSRRKGEKTFVFDGPVVHNSRANPRAVNRSYVSAYRYMQRKWRSHLPVRTCVVPLTDLGYPLCRYLIKRELRLLLKKSTIHHTRMDSVAISKKLGYE